MQQDVPHDGRHAVGSPSPSRRQKGGYYILLQFKVLFRVVQAHRWYDGKFDERRKDRERKRDNAERCRRYNEMHREERAAYARRRRQENPGLVAADNAYYKKKRRLAEKEAR